MRPFFALLSGLILAQASMAKADFDQDLDEADYASEVESADSPVAARVAGWNRWTCTAHGAGLQIRIYRGSSYYFRQGSGEGQEAKRVAQKIAVRNCEYAGVANCTSDLARCTVATH